MTVAMVTLQCVKVKNRLRVRIVSDGYCPWANCSFPRSLRVESKKYQVPFFGVTTVERSSGNFFYRISASHIHDYIEEKKETVDKVFDVAECCICLDAHPQMVIVPCGHLCLCQECSQKLTNKKCPLCRTQFSNIVHESKIR